MMDKAKKWHDLVESIKINEFEKENPEFGRTFSEQTSKELTAYKDFMLDKGLFIMANELKRAAKAFNYDNK